MPLSPWAQWLVDHNFKFVLYIIWVIILPVFWLNYIVLAMDDAEYVLNDIKQAKKGNE